MYGVFFIFFARLGQLTYKRPRILLRAYLLLIILSAWLTTAHASVKNWQGNIEYGFERDSTVVVEDIDRVLSESSNSRRLRFRLGYKQELADDLKFRFSASLSRKDYKSVEQFDRKSQLYSSSLTQRIGDLHIGGRLAYAKSKLNDFDFINYRQFSPYISSFISKKLYGQFSYQYTDKQIALNPDLSAIRHTVTLDSNYFIKGLRRYLQLSYRYAQENAEDDLFSYNLNQFKAAWIEKFSWQDINIEFRGHWRYQMKDYGETEDPVIDTFRRDHRQQFMLSLGTEIFTNWQLKAVFKKNNNHSNVEFADYRQRLWQLSLSYAF